MSTAIVYLYNENTFDDLEEKEWFQLLEGGGGMVTDCVACGQCESVCRSI